MPVAGPTPAVMHRTTRNHGGTSTRRWDEGLPPRTSVALWLFLAGVFTMSVQLEIPAFKDATGTRLPPGDIFLALSVLTAPNTVRLRRDPAAILPLAMLAMLAWGVLLALVYAGGVSNHALTVKFFGAVLLAVWALVAVHWARAGHATRILRMWLIGMVFWAVVAYIDWKIADIIGFLEPKTPSRFAGMMFDPNNAGAAYAVAVVVLWKFGARAFPSPWVRLPVAGILLFSLTQTFSRGGYLGLGGAVIVLVLFDLIRTTRLVRYLALGVLLVSAALATGLISDSIDEWARRPDNIKSRDELLSVGSDFFADSWGAGIGLGTYRARTGAIIHNTPIWLLVEMSVVGVAFIFAMTLIPMQQSFRIRRFDPELALALIGGHVVMLAASGGIEALYQRHWWLIVGLTAALPFHQRTSRAP